MPYADQEAQRAYNREWAKKNRATAANSPLCLAVEEIIVKAKEPVGPAKIAETLGRSNRNAIGVALDRLKHAGRIQNIGYGKWVPS